MLLLSAVLLANFSRATAQERVSLEGKVTLYGSEETIPYAQVLIKELNVWGFSDDKGIFKISGIIPGSYTLEATSLGYQKMSIPVTLNKSFSNFRVQLKEDNLTLEDVVVTAKAGSSMNSSSRIEKAAIQHVQASSLSDIMQLMPGAIIANPNLTSSNEITIRSVNDPADNNARGVGLMINGSRVSNDATISTATSTTFINTMDFRKFSTDNIESVEVLKGVLSAEYGDVTSGAILVTTKAGRTPYEVRIKADPRTKAFSLSKGFGLGDNAGNLNIDADYARAFADWRSPVSIFDRTTLGLTYSNTFNTDKTPLRLNVRLSGYMTGNSVTSDPDVSKEDFTKRRDKNLSLAIYGNWLLNKKWITSLNYNFSGNMSSEKYQKYSVNSSLPLPTTNTKLDGISLGYFTNTLERFDLRSEDIPVYMSAKVTGNLNKNIGKTLLKSIVGIEFNSKGNNGRGEYYIDAQPQYFRERSYKEIPFMNDLSIFAEEKVTMPVGKGSFEMSAGARFNKMIIEGYDYNPTVDPRFNAKYDILGSRRDRFVRSVAVRGGWGILQRLPSIGLLYPAPKYNDNALFLYRNATTGESLAVIQTDVINDMLDYNLKPTRTRNMEIGLDLDIRGIEAKFTYFNEKLTDGISENKRISTQSFDYYNTVTDPNAAPKYENGRVWIKNSLGEYVQLGYTTSREFKGNARTDNRSRTDKWGIEYDIDFGKIRSLNTSVILSGAYIRQENITEGLVYHYQIKTDPIDPKLKLPYSGIYKSTSGGLGVGTGAERFSTNINLVTNIPALRMVVSLITQIIWKDNTTNTYDKDRIYKLDSEGKPVYGNFDKQNNTEILYRNPDFYMDLDGNVKPFSDYYTTTNEDLRRRLALLILSSDNSYYFLESGYRPRVMANLRITKEIGNYAALSFYANNFTNSRPLMKNIARPNAVGARMNTEIYFGAELKLTF